MTKVKVRLLIEFQIYNFLIKEIKDKRNHIFFKNQAQHDRGDTIDKAISLCEI